MSFSPGCLHSAGGPRGWKWPWCNNPSSAASTAWASVGLSGPPGGVSPIYRGGVNVCLKGIWCFFQTGTLKEFQQAHTPLDLNKFQKAHTFR